MGFLTKIKGELITEGTLQNSPPKRIARIIATLAGKDEWLFTFYSEHTLWEEKPGLGTVGIRPYGDGENVVFVYDPEVFNNSSKEMIYFLLGHEVQHIVRDHFQRDVEQAAATGKAVNHHISNICQDVWINTDLHSEGTLAGYKMEPDTEGFAFRVGGKWGDVEKWVNEIIAQKEGKKPDPEEKYKGPALSEALYEWVVATLEKHDCMPKPAEPDEPQENYPQPGMIIRGPNGEYGRVISVNMDTKEVTEIEVLTKEEAYEAVKNA